jgi:hypothetical protein
MLLMNDKRANHLVLVQKADLTSRGIIPSSQELFDLMHLTTCEQAIQRWKAPWMFCPVCLNTADEDGSWDHKHPRDLIQ